ncbi:glycosyltransferase family 4 protein [Plantactinospora sp. KLBMP9567]|nr:glycosyltransferase family 4 protein [Plantactinospora sp. KLBMP9567]MDW5329355.1 glycosyltransferase family 4 protein [Plantactinospora sp. KLBMP9567]
MLVDNGVNGDSRVQKVARSAAEAGWEVTLLGRSPHGGAQTWRLGPAEVRLLPMPDPLARRRHEFRRAWLRWPLAYPPSGIAAHRAQWVKAWQTDIRQREAELTLAAGAGLVGRRLEQRRRRLRIERKAAHLLRRWVSLRYWMLTRARKGRKLTSPWDRLYTWFWSTVQGGRAWRRLEPGLWDYELAFGPVVDALAPDLIHAHDFRMIGVGARAKVRAAVAGREVKLVWDAHEFLPGVQPWQDNARWLPAHRAHEREYVPYADAAITVSASLAELLRREHGLVELPAVVLNAPDVTGGSDADAEPAPELRARCGIGPEVPLLVYSGAAAARRGLGTMIEALPQLPGVHVALVVNKPDGPYVRELLSRAATLGLTSRVHVLSYVEHWQVVPFLAGADVGVIPIHHWPNHEIALITKFFEYAHARLPLVVSDVRTMAETVRSTGQGEVFRAEDVDDYIRAVRAVLADRERYRAAYDRPGLLAGWTWRAQAEILTGVYRRLLADPDGPAADTGPPRGAVGPVVPGSASVDPAGRPAAGAAAR